MEFDLLIAIDDEENMEQSLQDAKLLSTKSSWNSSLSDNDIPTGQYIYEENLAVYLIEVSTELPTSSTVEIIELLNQPQTLQVDQLFIDNSDVFIENISEERQTMELSQTSIVKYTINTGDVVASFAIW